MLTKLTNTLNHFSPLAELSTVSLVLYGVLIVGIMVVALSSYRYLLLCILAGMGYGLLIEIFQAGLVQTFPLSEWHGYVVAMMITWLPAVGWMLYRSNGSQAYHLQQLQQSQDRESRADVEFLDEHINKQIEHTPIYQDYQPKFK